MYIFIVMLLCKRTHKLLWPSWSGRGLEGLAEVGKGLEGLVGGSGFKFQMGQKSTYIDTKGDA